MPVVLDDKVLSSDIQRKIVDYYNGRGEADNSGLYTIEAGLVLSSNRAVPADKAR